MKNTSKRVDSNPQEGSRRKRINVSKKTALGICVVLIACTLIVPGAVLSFFGTINVTANVSQAVVISDDGETWRNHDEPIYREIEDMEHCTDYCFKNWIKNCACEDACIELPINYVNAPIWFDGQPDFEGYHIDQFVFGETQTIRLAQKVVDFGNSPWEELEDGEDALLTFGVCDEQFRWDIDLTGSNVIDYSLIYYANYPDYWESSPVVVIGGLSGAVDIPSMPYADDENALRPIIDEGETYDHQYGAKFWFVPNDAIVDGELDWSIAYKFLFETDLGFYMDCDDVEPSPLENVWPIFNLYDGTSITLNAGSTYCWITCNRIDMNIVYGKYLYQQRVALC